MEEGDKAERNADTIYAVWYDDSIKNFMRDSGWEEEVKEVLGYARGRSEDILRVYRARYEKRYPGGYIKLKKVVVEDITPEKADKIRSLEDTVRKAKAELENLEKELEK